MALSLPLLLAGCVTSPRFDYRGTWKGTRNVALNPDTPEDVAVSIRQVILTFDGKGKFSLLESGVPKSGNFAPTSYGASLEVVEVMGRRLETQTDDVKRDVRTFEVRPKPDGTLEVTDPGPPRESFVLHRTSKP